MNALRFRSPLLIGIAPFVLLLTQCHSPRLHPEALPGTQNPIKIHPIVRAYQGDSLLHLSPDTGAPQDLVIFQSAADRIGLDTKPGRFLGTANTHVTYTPDAEKAFKQAYILDAPVSDFDGLIGWPEIRRGVWHLNLPDRRHEFHGQLPTKIKHWPSLPIVEDEAMLKVRLPDGKIAVIDTGASRAIHLSPRLFEAWQMRYPSTPITLYSGYSPAAKNGYFAKRCGRAPVFELGGIPLYDVMVHETFAEVAAPGIPYDIDLLIGLEAFAERELWIDGPGQRIYFGERRYSTWMPSPVSLVRAVFIPVKDEGPLVAHVLPGGVASAAGLVNGDQLLSLDGQLDFSRSKLKAALSIPGTAVKLKVLRINQEVDLRWVVPTRY